MLLQSLDNLEKTIIQIEQKNDFENSLIDPVTNTPISWKTYPSIKDIPDNTFPGCLFASENETDIPSVNELQEIQRVLLPGGNVAGITGIINSDELQDRLEKSGFTVSEVIQHLEHPSSPENGLLYSGYKKNFRSDITSIILNYKPFKGSYANNALKLGVAGYNLGELKFSYDNKQARFLENIIIDENTAYKFQQIYPYAKICNYYLHIEKSNLIKFTLTLIKPPTKSRLLILNSNKGEEVITGLDLGWNQVFVIENNKEKFEQIEKK